VLDKIDYPAVVAEGDFLGNFFSLVLYLYPQPAVEECHFPHPLGDDVEVKIHALEHVRIGRKAYYRPRPHRFTHHFEGGYRRAFLIPLLVYLAFPSHFQDQPLRKGVHHRYPNAMKAPGNAVYLAAELPTGVQCGQYDLGGRFFLLFHHSDGDASSVIHDGYGLIRVYGYPDVFTEACQTLINTVVHDLVHQVMKAPGACRPYVHARSFFYRFESL